jgi:hypothetical protein
MPLNAKLVVVGGEVKTAEIKLRLPSTIGRGRGASIMLPHPLVSRQHCELFESQGRLMVRDLGSLNGTFINNERISEAPLPAGELLTIGAVTFRAIYEADNSAPMVPVDAASGEAVVGGDARGGDPQGTVRAPGKSPKSSAATVNFDEPIAAEVAADDFDLSQPVTPVDEGARVTVRAAALPAEDAAAEARKTEPTAPPKPDNSSTQNPAAMAGKPATATAGEPAAAKPAGSSAASPPGGKGPEKKDEPTVHFAAWEDEEAEVRPAAIEDEDFGDFLKSLEKKP